MAQDPLCFRLGTVNELSSTGTAASLELGGALLLNVLSDPPGISSLSVSPASPSLNPHPHTP